MPDEIQTRLVNIMASPNLKALVDGIEKLGQSCGMSDPTLQQVIATSVALAEMLVGDAPHGEDPDCAKLRGFLT